MDKQCRKEAGEVSTGGREETEESAGGRPVGTSTNLLWLCIIFCKVKLTEMEAILHGTVAMANK